MAAITHREVAADVALKFFKKPIQVQTARAVKAKGDDGKVREGFDVKMEQLSADHVLSAKAWSDGRVTITTIDGKRHEAKGTIAEEPAAPAAPAAPAK